MNGNDFLDKLQHLDPELVAAASQEPQKERRWRPNWGSWLAVAACLAMLCLPLALSYLIQHNLLPASGSSYNLAASASHQAPQEAADEVQEEAALTEDTQKAAFSLDVLPQGVSRSQSGYGKSGSDDSYTWELIQMTSEYCQSFESGLPPIEEFFQYNLDVSAGELFHEYDADLLSAQDSGGDSTPYYWDTGENLITLELPSLSSGSLGSSQVYRSTGVLGAVLDLSDMSFYNRISVYWPDTSSGTEDGQDTPVTLTLCTTPLLDSEEMARMCQASNETQVIPAAFPSKGPAITALGSLNSDKVLTGTLAGGSWFRIHCTSQVSMEDIKAILDWVLDQDNLLETVFGNQQALTSTYLEALETALPAEFLSYCPMDPEWVPLVVDTLDTQKTSQTLEGSEARIYFAEDPAKPLSAWYIYSPETYNPDRPPQAYPKTESGTFEELTYDAVWEEYERQRISHEANSMPHTFRLSFFWDDYYVGGDFTEAATFEEIWSFIEYLQSMDEDLHLVQP